MRFVIDVNNQRVKNSMLVLGINPEELIKKEIEEFDEKNTREEIIHLRYNYFTRKQQELVRQIKQNIRENILKTLEKQQKASLSNCNTQKLSDIFELTENTDELSRIKEEHQKKILRRLQKVQDSFKEFNAIQEKLRIGEDARKKIKTSLIKKRDKSQAFKEKQQENYES